MKALVLHEIGDLRYDDVELPKRLDDEVTVHIQAAGICGSDVPRVFEKGTYTFPTIPGHEFSGIITDANDKLLVGKKVAVFPLIPCGKCPSCSIGKYELCNHYDYYGSRRDGGFAEYLQVKLDNIVVVPDDMDLRHAAMAEPSAVALHAIRQVGLKGFERVAIWGIGPIGLLVAMWLKRFGVKQIILVARDQKKLDFAKSLGFINLINSNTKNVVNAIQEITDNEGVHVCIEGTGASQPLAEALQSIAREGTLLTMGNPAGKIELAQADYWCILRKQLKLIGTWNSSHNLVQDDWKDAIYAMYIKAIDVEPLISHEYKLQNYVEAFELIKNKQIHTCKVMFVN
ncbi:galactitol-1-phosphate 5-dehydrogenase [Veillonella caviae]|uniref:galactitol-1-phosphate 5-dehydrogenase n=1 Tax=Veillonella caviae TaxID=248316 RepID=UPI0023F0E091|nr:galactitol-1-phosphate 5-dehydrogenase [Veillonella caviae]MCI6406537.1 galactitol-1-phosphate 5-dehydrogenase [Veillonella caviae]MDY6225907.1 galactitol-1-phosphate 5-dehydrogenase [Veillonella caviae]